VGMAVTSLGVPYESFAAVLPDNPHVRFFESRFRGHVRCEVTPNRWTTDLWVLDDVRAPRARAAAPRGRRRRSATSGKAVRAMELTGRPLTPNY
jgi:phosphodiesterase/alkaline phosphatase D-like protein